MKIAGIIAEYDPFHNGHALQLRRLRQAGAQTIVVCLSCDVVQRGAFALLPPAVRVQAALQSGADVVLALPNPYACQSAEGFAAAGVALLSAFGCDTLAFGASRPEADFAQAARLLSSPSYAQALREELQKGTGFAAARAAAARRLSPALAQLIEEPNNNLGVEYARAVLAQGAPLRLYPMQREGAGHGAPPQDGLTSAGYLRGLWPQGWQTWRPWTPPDALALYRKAAPQAIDPHAADIALLSRLRALSGPQWAAVRGVSEGVERRLQDALRTAVTLPQLYEAAKTRRYAHARLRRLALDAALGYTEGLPARPPYLHVLGARRAALGLCGEAALPCGVSLARLAEQSPQAALVAQWHARAADLAALCRAAPQPMGLAYTQPPVLL